MKATIEVLVDPSVRMAQVSTRIEDVDHPEMFMIGNYEDFYTGCHGIKKFGYFKGPTGMAVAIKSYLEDLGFQVSIDKYTAWTYRD